MFDTSLRHGPSQYTESYLRFIKSTPTHEQNYTIKGAISVREWSRRRVYSARLATKSAGHLIGARRFYVKIELWKNRS